MTNAVFSRLQLSADFGENAPHAFVSVPSYNMWGINGTSRVLIEYTKAARNQGHLLDPVDVKVDGYGFVFAPTKSSQGIYNPFKTAFAYHRPALRSPVPHLLLLHPPARPGSKPLLSPDHNRAQ